MRSRTTFKKRQKELARQEKQRDKAARRMQRKQDKISGVAPASGEDEILDDADADADADHSDSADDFETVSPLAENH